MKIIIYSLLCLILFNTPVLAEDKKLLEAVKLAKHSLDAVQGKDLVCSESNLPGNGFDVRCEGLGKAFCDHQNDRKPYDYLKDPTYVKMMDELDKQGMNPAFVGIKGEFATGYFSSINKELFSRGQITPEELEIEFKKMKKTLPELWPATSDEKVKIAGLVNGTRVLSLGEALPLIWATKHNPEAKKFFTKNTVKPCNMEGEGGFTPNAFRIQNYDAPTKKPIIDVPEKELIIYCPGLLLSIIQNAKSKTEMINAMVFAMGHEMTHTFDAQKNPELHTEWLACFKSKYNVEGFDPNIIKIMPKEFSADVGGTLLLLDRLSKQDENTVYNSMKQIFAPLLCKTKTSEGAMLRLNLIGRHPKVLKALGCGESKVLSCPEK